MKPDHVTFLLQSLKQLPIIPKIKSLQDCHRPAPTPPPPDLTSTTLPLALPVPASLACLSIISTQSLDTCSLLVRGSFWHLCLADLPLRFKSLSGLHCHIILSTISHPPPAQALSRLIPCFISSCHLTVPKHVLFYLCPLQDGSSLIFPVFCSIPTT